MRIERFKLAHMMFYFNKNLNYLIYEFCILIVIKLRPLIF